MGDPIAQTDPKHVFEQTKEMTEASIPSNEGPMPLLYRGHVAGLDLLRGGAIIMVLLLHGFDGVSSWTRWHGPLRYLIFITHFGNTGVHLFFVMSGFLITGILLDSKNKPRYYKKFYVRRALRILPAYLLTLVVIKIWLGVTWNFFFACLLYIANMAALLGAKTAEYGVVWSLAVEEQFYLVWPNVVKACGRTAFARIIVAFLILTPILRALITLRTSGADNYTKTWVNIDYLLYGALIALFIREKILNVGNADKVCAWLFTAGAICIPIAMYLNVHHGSKMVEAFSASVGILPFIWIFVALVIRSVGNHTRRASAVPTKPGNIARFLAFLGYISYGLYLIHQFVWAMYDRAIEGTIYGTYSTNLNYLLIRFVVGTVVASGVAFLSRKFYEDRFLDLKERLAP